MEKLVFDASGTTIKYALMSSDATILEEGRRPTPDGATATFDEFLGIVSEAYRNYAGRVDGIALSLPGRIDSASGLVITPGALTYNRGRNVADEIRAHVAELPTVVVNDGKAAAAAEYWKGNLKGCECGVVMLLGSGIGGGIVMGGRVWDGANCFAGEFSYVMERPSMRSYEESGWTFRGSIPSLIDYVSKRTGMKRHLLDGKKVFQMIEAGNDYALAGLKDMTDYIAYMVYDVSCILDPDRFLLGGSIVRQPLILQLVQEELVRIRGLVHDDIPRTEVGICALPREGSLIGALHTLVSRYPELG